MPAAGPGTRGRHGDRRRRQQPYGAAADRSPCWSCSAAAMLLLGCDRGDARRVDWPDGGRGGDSSAPVRGARCWARSASRLIAPAWRPARRRRRTTRRRPSGEPAPRRRSRWHGAKAATRYAPGPDRPADPGANPCLGVDAALETLHSTGTECSAMPKDYGRPGWFAEGTRPGDIGPAVIAGHVDSTRGPAVFFRLCAAEAGRPDRRCSGAGLDQFTGGGGRAVRQEPVPHRRVYGSTPTRNSG